MPPLAHPTFSAIIPITAFALATTAHAEWPQFRGIDRSGVDSQSPPLQLELPAAGLKEIWSYQLGDGFAGPVVSGNRVLVFHREGDLAVIDCLESATGERRWTDRYPTKYRDDFGFDPGPRSSPTIAGNTVFTYGPDGMLTANSLTDGARSWQLDLASAYSAPKGFFGRAGAPLVASGNVILNIGGTTGNQPAGIVAFNVETGAEAWHSTSHEASYSSPITTRFSGRETAVFLTRDGLIGVEAASGKPLFEAPYRPSINASVNAASPVMCGPGNVFLSTCYGVGGSLWRLAPNSDPEKLWMKEGVLDAHYATPVFVGGHLYGFHGRQETGTELRCVDPFTAKVLWSSDELSCGQLIAAGGELIVLTEDGELALVEASPEAFRLRWRTQILRRPTRCIPALSGGFLFARGPKRLVCIDLRKNPS